ncbi:MAG: hypothetical protein AB3N64_03660 [Puniceicoccaceae bacterium]
MPRRIKSILVWGLLWFGLVGLICLAGAIAGAILFPVVGFLLGMDLSAGEMLRNGLYDGGFFALIWAPGLSLVICIMRVHALSSKNRG